MVGECFHGFARSHLLKCFKLPLSSNTLDLTQVCQFDI